MDGYLVYADAAKGSVVKSDPEMIERLRADYAMQEGKLEGEPIERIEKAATEGSRKKARSAEARSQPLTKPCSAAPTPTQPALARRLATSRGRATRSTGASTTSMA